MDSTLTEHVVSRITGSHYLLGLMATRTKPMCNVSMTSTVTDQQGWGKGDPSEVVTLTNWSGRASRRVALRLGQWLLGKVTATKA